MSAKLPWDPEVVLRVDSADIHDAYALGGKMLIVGQLAGFVQDRGGLAALTTLERSYISHLSSVDCRLRLATASSRLPH
jgi:hypothetical protein